ncbi:MAG: hypothetical protein ACFB50_08515 [Rubrobacteraceae bacterium]
MDLDTFVVVVFCLVDDRLKGSQRSYRQRGPAPKLSDSEVIAIEIVGEFLGIDSEKVSIYWGAPIRPDTLVSQLLCKFDVELHPDQGGEMLPGS